MLAALDMPPSFVLLDRVVWGVSALLGRLGATNRWRAIVLELPRRPGRSARPPRLGEQEATWADYDSLGQALARALRYPGPIFARCSAWRLRSRTFLSASSIPQSYRPRSKVTLGDDA